MRTEMTPEGRAAYETYDRALHDPECTVTAAWDAAAQAAIAAAVVATIKAAEDDTIVIALRHAASTRQLREFRELAEKHAPGVRFVFVLDADAMMKTAELTLDEGLRRERDEARAGTLQMRYERDQATGVAENLRGQLAQAASPASILASLPRQWEAEAHATQDPAYANGLRDCARELRDLLSKAAPAVLAEPAAVVAPRDNVAPELRDAMAETRRVAETVRPVLDCFTKASDGWRGRVSAVVLARAYKATGPVPDHLKYVEGQ